jgi:hypothetical protein
MIKDFHESERRVKNIINLFGSGKKKNIIKGNPIFKNDDEDKEYTPFNFRRMIMIETAEAKTILNNHSDRSLLLNSNNRIKNTGNIVTINENQRDELFDCMAHTLDNFSASPVTPQYSDSNLSTFFALIDNSFARKIKLSEQVYQPHSSVNKSVHLHTNISSIVIQSTLSSRKIDQTSDIHNFVVSKSLFRRKGRII